MLAVRRTSLLPTSQAPQRTWPAQQKQHASSSSLYLGSSGHLAVSCTSLEGGLCARPSLWETEERQPIATCCLRVSEARAIRILLVTGLPRTWLSCSTGAGKAAVAVSRQLGIKQCCLLTAWCSSNCQ